MDTTPSSSKETSPNEKVQGLVQYTLPNHPEPLAQIILPNDTNNVLYGVVLGILLPHLADSDKFKRFYNQLFGKLPSKKKLKPDEARKLYVQCNRQPKFISSHPQAFTEMIDAFLRKQFSKYLDRYFDQVSHSEDESKLDRLVERLGR